MQDSGNRVADVIAAWQANSVTEAEIAEWEWLKTYTPQMRNAGLDDRFIVQIDGSKWNRKQQIAFEKADARAQNVGAIIALIGIRGVGKTMIAGQLILRRLHEWHEWFRQPQDERSGLTKPRGLGVYRKMARIVMDLKSLYSDFGSIDTERQMREREKLLERSLLIVDELHDCEDQKLKNRILTDIVDCRYSARRDTILISNQTPDEFQSTTSDSVLSRLNEHGCIIPCQWQSFR